MSKPILPIDSRARIIEDVFLCHVYSSSLERMLIAGEITSSQMQGKSVIDKTYKERNSTNLWNDVHGVYRLLKDERRREVLFLKHRWPKVEISRNYRYAISDLYIFIRKKYFVKNYLLAINYGSLSNSSFIRRIILRIIRRNHYKYD
jgi:hypothetical protein